MSVEAETLTLPVARAMAAGERERAVELARAALGEISREPARLLTTATRLFELGLGRVARAAFERALQRAPGDVDLRFRWAIYNQVTDNAAAALREVDSLLLAHDNAELHALRGMALRRLGRQDEAALALQSALRADPTRTEWWNQVGDLRLEQRRLEDAIRAYNAALQAARRRGDSGSGPVTYALLRLADCFARSNLTEEAWRFSEAALTADPSNIRARWSDLHLLPIIYQDQAQIRQVRDRYEARLTALGGHLDLSDQMAASSAVAGMKIPFYLHYQGGDMRPIMQRFGHLADRCVRAWRPDLAAFEPAPRPDGDTRIRVGFCSYLFRQHTITKLFGGWMHDLDRSRFSVHVFHLGPTRDAVTDALADGADSFHHLVGKDAATICTRMREQALDMVIFPELGMATTTYQVAAMRVAPVQAVAWGHPITTGLPSVDLFLSSEAMEPDHGDEHYTERMVRLPGLSIRPSAPTEPSSRDRASFGLDEDDVVYLVPQSLFKLLPGEDELFVRILRQVPAARLVLLHNHSPVVTGLFQKRLSEALRRAELDPERRLVFVPQLSWEDYLALNRCADVFLDGLTWSGGMTTLEALAMGLVPVTLPGDQMRSRHTAAILRELGLDETIASTRDEYVQLAVTLGADAAWRRSLQERIGEALPALYEDTRPIEALQQVIEAACRLDQPHQRKPTVAVGATW